MSRVPLFTLVVAALVAACLPAAGDKASPPDFTKTPLADLGVKPVTPRKDPKTGFVVGGKNATAALGKLTEVAGRSVADLERDMRPGGLSDKGFLGKDERLLDVLKADNRFVVDEKGLTHQELARHLHVLGAAAVRHVQGGPLELLYHGRRFRVEAACTRGFQESPFKDGTKANCDVTVQNVASGKKLSYSLLVPHMVERYGFYEGKGTPYRVEPKTVLEVLDFISPPAKKGR